ncbi:hypothetical protein GGR54DRAFT_598226, partial [Hypoxylon sp. NC1633]
MIGALAPSIFYQITRERNDWCNTFYVLEQAATNKSSKNRPYILFQEKSWTFAQVYEMALRYGNLLKTKFGVKSKDVVSVDLQNSDDFVFVCFGLWSIGAKPAFINYNLIGEALVHCVKTANPVLMVVGP